MHLSGSHLVRELTIPSSSAEETLVEKLIIEMWVGTIKAKGTIKGWRCTWRLATVRGHHHLWEELASLVESMESWRYGGSRAGEGHQLLSETRYRSRKGPGSNPRTLSPLSLSSCQCFLVAQPKWKPTSKEV